MKKATLGWDGARLLAQWDDVTDSRQIVGRVRSLNEAGLCEYVVSACGDRVVSDPYESDADARQDCETDVRRLLREAGVVVS